MNDAIDRIQPRNIFVGINHEIRGATRSERLALNIVSFAGRMSRRYDYLGFSYVVRIARRLTGPGPTLAFEIGANSRFAVPWLDPYWSRLLADRVYEREVDRFFRYFSDIDFGFIDCGANYGYWSIQLSGPEFGNHPSIAIEPVASSFDILRQNQIVNGSRFQILRSAVHRIAGKVVNLYGKRHEAASMANAEGPLLGTVETVTLDDIADTYLSWAPLVVKLDVEGSEVEALEGAATILARDTLIIFEDHGSDPSCKVSDWFFKRENMLVFYWSESGLIKLSSIAEVSRIKARSRVGYNFIGTSSRMWSARLDQVLNT